MINIIAEVLANALTKSENKKKQKWEKEKIGQGDDYHSSHNLTFCKKMPKRINWQTDETRKKGSYFNLLFPQK